MTSRLHLLEEVAKAARKYLNNSPPDGWHFEACTYSEDIDDDCTCGTLSDETRLIDSLSSLDAAETVDPKYTCHECGEPAHLADAKAEIARLKDCNRKQSEAITGFESELARLQSEVEKLKAYQEQVITHYRSVYDAEKAKVEKLEMEIKRLKGETE